MYTQFLTKNVIHHPRIMLSINQPIITLIHKIDELLTSYYKIDFNVNFNTEVLKAIELTNLFQ